MLPGCRFLSALVLALATVVLPQPRLAAQTPPGSRPDATPMGASDALQARRDSLMNVVLRTIAGREELPADSVFENVRTLKGIPAGRVLRMMNVAFSRSLGVSCDHCHVLGEWEKEDKPQKQIARDMWGLMHTINGQLLPKIGSLKSENPGINCTTCHRGEVKPAVNLPPQ